MTSKLNIDKLVTPLTNRHLISWETAVKYPSPSISGLETIEKISVKDQTLEQLKNYILSGVVPLGESLPSERALGIRGRRMVSGCDYKHVWWTCEHNRDGYPLRSIGRYLARSRLSKQSSCRLPTG